MTPALFAFLHHIAAFVVFGTLFAELMLVKQELTQPQVRLLPRIDVVYGIAAMALIVFGLVRVYFTEKGAAYYLHSATFIAKIVLFAIVGLLSIQPTRRFLAWRRELQAGRQVQPSAETLANIRKFVHAELALLAIVILCAVLMARGIGYFG